jgi:hypothetical protein
VADPSVPRIKILGKEKAIRKKMVEPRIERF